MLRGAVVVLSLLAGGQPDVRQIRPVEDEPKRKYVPFDIHGNPEQIFADLFLRSPAGQDVLREQFEKLRKDPKSLEELAKRFADDPLIGALVKKAAKEAQWDKDGPNLDALQKHFADLLKKGDGLDKLLDGLDKNGGSDQLRKLLDGFGDLKLPDAGEPAPADSWEDRVGDWLLDYLKREDVQEELAEFLKHVPELQDVVRSLNDLDAPGNWAPKFPDLPRDFTLPEVTFKLDGLPQLPAIQMPQMPRFNLPMPNLGDIRLPRPPAFGRPRLPDAPNMPRDFDWLYVVVGAVLLGLTMWLLGKLKWPAKRERDEVAAFLASLPESIATRSQLRQAFDAFAVARLGLQAVPWNHRHVARQLGATGETARAADALARLYELARYTPGDDQLSPAEQDAVRTSLAVLAGGAA